MGAGLSETGQKLILQDIDPYFEDPGSTQLEEAWAAEGVPNFEGNKAEYIDALQKADDGDVRIALRRLIIEKEAA